MAEQLFQPRDERKANHHWADNEVIDIHASRIGAYGYAVYMFICRYAGNRDGKCTKTQAEIASTFGISRDTVQRAIEKLVAEKLLAIENGDPEERQKTGKPCAYIVLEVEKQPTAHSGRGSKQPTAISGTYSKGNLPAPAVPVPPTAAGVPLLAAGVPLTAARNKEVRLSQDLFKTGETERPPFPSALKAFMEEIDPLRTAPDEEKFRGVQRAAKQNGLSLQQAKQFLSDHPDWRHWKYLSQLDSQQEIDFGPDKPLPVPVVEKQPPPMASGERAWEFIRDHLQHRTSPHSFETWIKPLRVAGILQKVLYVKIPAEGFRQVGEKFSMRRLIIDSRADSFKGVEDICFVTYEELLNLDREKTTA